MTPSEIIQRRLSNQRLLGNGFKTPVEAVRWLGAVQSQDYAGGKLALGLRLRNATDTVIENSFNKGEFIRLHIMRPTWHFVLPEDVRWLMDLTAHRVIAASASRYRELELNKAIFSKAAKVLTKTLSGGNFLTRKAITARLAEEGVSSNGEGIGHILGQLELDQVICSGPKQGKQFTYALFDERVPASKPWPREKALAELTRRYFTSHGPATAADFAWWSGLTLADAKMGLTLVGTSLISEVIEGQTYWFAELKQAPKPNEPTVQLMPNYDEFIVAYSNRTMLYNNEHDDKLDARGNFLFNHTIVLDGRVVGTWRRTVKKDVSIIEPTHFVPLNKAQQKAFEAAVEEVGRFWGVKTEIGNQ